MTLPAIPKHWAKGNNGTAALLNTHWRDAINRLHWTGAFQTANLTKNNDATLANLSGLAIPVVSGERWIVVAHSFFVTNATADAKWAITAPASSTGRYGILGPGAGLGDLSSGTFGTGLARAAPGTNEDNQMLFGDITAGATGNIQLQAAQNTATVVDTIFRGNSFIVGFRISGGNSPIATFTASQVISATDFQTLLSDKLKDLRFRYGFLREDVSVTNSTTLQDLPGMSFPVKAGEIWVWFAFLYFRSTAAGDVAVAADLPSGLFQTAGRYGLVGNGNPISPGSTSIYGDPVAMVIGNTSEQHASFNGLVVVVNDGTLQMQAAQSTASAGETMTMEQDSWFVAFRL
jgi:hypothetical protein